MRILILCFLLVSLYSCEVEKKLKIKKISEVEINPVLRDSTLSIRAIELLDEQSLAFAANNNTFGLYNIVQNQWLISKQEYDSLNLQFRAIANNQEDFFMLSIANPALLFKTGEEGNMELVYKEAHEKVFYDSMDFWNQKEGIAIGDATEGCLSIIITRDGGVTWKKLPCEILPKTIADEGAFAASDSNIAIVNNHTWVATTAGRVYYSPDKGKTWEVYDTPIVKNKATEGIYSLDFYDEKIGFAIGGDYTNPKDNRANKIMTKDGGKTWKLVGENQNPGYRSCVQYVPNSQGKALVAVGFEGVDFSNDGGYTWKHLTDESFYTIRFLNDSIAYAAGQGRIDKLIFQ